MNELANFTRSDGCLQELALFAGAGGGILGSKLIGWRTICAVEWEPYAAGVLAARQNDGILPPFPIWSDIRSFNGEPWRGLVDVVSGGFPCQDISAAGSGAGIEGERSGLWKEMARVIGEVRPRFVFVENSPMLTSRGLGVVLGDLASLGYDAEWGVISASDTGAPHLRERIWILGYSHDNGLLTSEIRRSIAQRSNNPSSRSVEAEQSARPSEQHGKVANAIGNGLQGVGSEWPASRPAGLCCGTGGDQKRGIPRESNGGWKPWPIEPDVGRVVDGLADRVHRLKALGNGQVPRVVRTAWHLLKND